VLKSAELPLRDSVFLYEKSAYLLGTPRFHIAGTITTHHLNPDTSLGSDLNSLADCHFDASGSHTLCTPLLHMNNDGSQTLEIRLSAWLTSDRYTMMINAVGT
jgi:hypothetical protein